MNTTAANVAQSGDYLADNRTQVDSNYSSHFESPAKTIQTIVLPTIYSIVCVIGLIGNGLVIYIMHLKVRNRNITDLYVLNLAIADFIFVAMLPFWTTDIAMSKRWVFGRVFCKLASGSTYFHMYASVFFLTAMSVDRFLAVVMYQSCRRTKIMATAGVISIWVFSTLLGLLPLFFRDVIGTSESPRCDWIFDSSIPSHGSWFLAYFISRSILGFCVPFLIILISYSLIIFFLKTRETRGKLTSKCQDRATKMVLVVIGVFLLCWLPNQISNLVYVAQALGLAKTPESPSMTHYYVHMTSTCLAWMHSCINPILYAFMREDMRVKFTEILNYHVKRCCGATPRKNSSITHSSNYSVVKRNQNPDLQDDVAIRARNVQRSSKEIRGLNRQTSLTESIRLTTIGSKPSFDEDIEVNDLTNQVNQGQCTAITSELHSSYTVDECNNETGACHALIGRHGVPSTIIEESSSAADDVIHKSAVTINDDDNTSTILTGDVTDSLL